MVRKSRIVTIIFCMVCSTWSFTLTPDQKLLSGRVIDLIINCNFTEAIRSTDSLTHALPGDPLYPYLHLCALGLRDLDFDQIIDTNAFLASYDKTIQTIEDYEKLHGRDSYSLTLLGFAYASHSSFYLMHKKYFSAIGTGLDAVKLFDEVKKMDSTNYEVEFFLGFYNYAKSELRKKLWMVLFWYSGDKKEGIRSLELCSKKGLLTSEGARMVLIDIYTTESKYETSQAIARAMLKKYPSSRLLYWSQARYHEARKEWVKAAEEYGRLGASYAREEYGTYNALQTRIKQCELLDKADQKAEAARVAQGVIDNGLCSKSDSYDKLCRDLHRFARK